MPFASLSRQLKKGGPLASMHCCTISSVSVPELTARYPAPKVSAPKLLPQVRKLLQKHS